MSGQKQTGMNSRLKSHINRLGSYLAPLKKEHTSDRQGNLVISFSDSFRCFRIVMSQFVTGSNHQLPIEDQRLYMTLKDRSGEYFTADLDIEDAKETLNNLGLFLAGIPFMLHNNNITVDVSLPKLKKHLFDVDYSESDTSKFLELFETHNQKNIEAEEVILADRHTLEKAQHKYDSEFKNRSKQGEIDALRSVLERLEREEEELKNELSSKHEITHLENVVNGKQEQSHGQYKDYMDAAAHIIAKHKLSIDFSIVEELLKENRKGRI